MNYDTMFVRVEKQKKNRRGMWRSVERKEKKEIRNLTDKKENPNDAYIRR